MSNITHRKQLARALAAATELTYQQALDVVIAAHEEGRLPARLDEDGRAAALAQLLTADPAPRPAHSPDVSPPLPEAAGEDEPDGPVPAAPDSAGPFGQVTVQTEVRVALCQVADLIDAGLGWVDAWSTVAVSSPDSQVREAAATVAAALADGSRSSAALELMPHLFAPVVVALVRAGEASGRVAWSLRTAAAGLERDSRMRRW